MKETAPTASQPAAQRRPFRRVLVANRGEIAVRIIRTLREMGLESVAVYSDGDEQSLHRQLADFAVRLPGVASYETYLDIAKLTQAIHTAGADAVHPGYGFLSESSTFARAVAQTGATFIGPSPEAMEQMGNKIAARALMLAHGVPVVPGAKTALQDETELRHLATQIGYPLILKAAGGGGGRGMRVVRTDAELGPALAACQREAQAYFGNPDVFCERYIEHPRHIEFQVLFDMHGHGVHLFERDCSVQRRHQKLLEEAPSQFLDVDTRARIGAQAVAAAKAAGYVGVGTIEFICESPQQAYFMEMNTRIQVEHPVTELITGIDLVAMQIRVAQGEPLPFVQEDLQIKGWAVETRINAEDPSRDFAPAPGVVSALTLPSGPNVRVDTHLYPGYRIPDTYDSLVAKLITWGPTREEALRRMLRSLAELRLGGIPSTARFHEALIRHPAFVRGDYTTRFIEENAAYWQETLQGDAASAADEAPVLAALAAILAADETDRSRPETTATTKTSTETPSLWRAHARRSGLA